MSKSRISILWHLTGGFDLAAEWMGWNNVLSCEIDSFCNKVLAYHFPNAIHYEDIKTTDFIIHRGQIDIITGGFPCQPFSMAGKRRGTDDDRHLWPEMLRAIKEIQPRWIVGENVLGFTNWNGGVVFREVLSDLENEGYEVQSFIIPACAVNAPHRRDRVWIVAHSTSELQQGDESRKYYIKRGEILQQKNRKTNTEQPRTMGKNGDASDTGHIRQAERQIEAMGNQQLCEERIIADTDSKRGKGERELPKSSGEKRISDNIPGWHNFPTESPLRSRNDGISAGLDGITVSKLRNESIKAAGNAIVPQVVFQIFKVIEQYESLYKKL